MQQNHFFLTTKHQSRLIEIFLLLFTTTILIKQTHCAGNKEKEKVPLEVHGVTEVWLDQLYTQLLFGKEEENQAAFSRLHCRISTFLLVREINAVLEDPKEGKKIKNWLKPAADDDDGKATSTVAVKRHSKNKAKKSQKLSEADVARKEANVRQLRFVIEEDYKKMNFDGLNCERKHIFKLSELYNILWQVNNQQRDIHQLVIGPDERDDETGQKYAQRLNSDTGKMHWKVMRKLLDNVRDGKLRDRMFGISAANIEATLAMKQRLRRVIGESMFEIAELQDPLLLRIDIVEKPHLVSLYQRLFSLRVEKTAARQSIVAQLKIPQIVSFIRARKAGQKDFKKEFQRFWEKNVKHFATNLTEVFNKLLEYWILHASALKGMDAVYELNNLIVAEDKRALTELLRTDKLGKDFKQFLDQKKGAKARLVHMLMYGMDAHAFVRENPKLAQLIFEDFTAHKISDELTTAYTHWFTSDTSEKYEKGHLAADVLLRIRDLNTKFGETEQWTLYRAMFLIFVDQLEDAEPEFVQNFGTLYMQMLCTLHNLEGGQENLVDFETVLSNDLSLYMTFIEVENKGELKQIRISLKEHETRHRLDADHRAAIVHFQGTQFGERLNQNLGHVSQRRMNAFLHGEEPSINRPSNTTNEIVIPTITNILSSSALASPTQEPSNSGSTDKEIVTSITNTVSQSNYSLSAQKSSFFECPKQHKTLDKSDKGFDQLRPYEQYLTTDTDDPEDLKKMINLHTAIWHYQKVISDLFSKIRNKFPKEKEELGKLLKELIDIMKSVETTETEVKARNNVLEQKMCKLLVFLHLLKEFLLQMTEPGELQNETVEILGEIENQFPNKELANANLQCDFNNSPDIANNMIKALKMKKIHFDHLYFLLKKYDSFKLFFCKQPSAVKDKLHKLMGAKLLEKLERWFPEVLKIHEFQDDVRYHLYKKFVVNRKDSKEATDAEDRLLFRMSLAYLRWVEQLKPEEFLNDHIHRIVQEKTAWLKQLVFGNPITMTSAWNICKIFDLRVDVENHCIKNKEKKHDEKASAKKMENWRGKDCEKKDYFDYVFKTLREGDDSTNDHKNFINTTVRSKISELLHIRGYGTRFRRLVPKLSAFYDLKLIDSHAMVREMIELALVERDEEKREMNRLGFGFASWFHWMDAKFNKDDKKWAQDHQRLVLIHKFDAIFDAHLSELRGPFGLRLVRMQAVIRDAASNGKFHEMDKAKLQNLMEPSNAFIERWKGKKEMEQQWLQSLNRQEMLAQLTKSMEGVDTEKKSFSADEGNIRFSEEFLRNLWRLRLKEELEENKEARKRLPLLFGRVRSGIEPILKAIPLEVEANELDLMEDKKEVKYEIERQRKSISEKSKSTGGKNQIKKAKKKRNESSKASKTLASEASEDSGLEASDSINLSSDEAEPSTNKETSQSGSTSSTIQLDSEDLMQSSTMEEGDWKVATSSRKNQNKTTAHKTTANGAATSSSTSNDIKSFHLSRIYGPKYASFSDYIPDAPPKSTAYKKDKDIKTDLNASKPVEQQLADQTSHPIKKGQIFAAASHKPQKMFWAHVLGGNPPAVEGQTASTGSSSTGSIDEPKSAWGQEKSRNEPAADVLEEKKQTAENGPLLLLQKSGEDEAFLSAKHTSMPKVDPSQMMFGSLNLKTLEAANQKAVKQSVQLAKTQNDEPRKMPTEKKSEQTKNHFKPTEIMWQKPLKILKRPTAEAESLKEEQQEEYKITVSRGKEELVERQTMRTVPSDNESSSTDEHTSLGTLAFLGQPKSHNEPVSEFLEEEKKQAAINELLLLQKKKEEDEDDTVFNKAEQHAIRRESSSAMAASPHQRNSMQSMRTGQWVKKLPDEVESLRRFLIRKRQFADIRESTHQAVGILRSVVRSWTQNRDWHLASGTVHIQEAVLLFTGSYLLQLKTLDSDIDCVVLLPFAGSSYRDWELLYKQFFFGNEFGVNNEEIEVPCDLPYRHCPNNVSLFCILCRNPGVTSLHKLKGRDQIPMITMKFYGIEFDLLFVPVPKHITDKLIIENRKNHFIPMLNDLLSMLPNMDIMIDKYIEWMEKTQQGPSQEHLPSQLKNDNRYGMLLALSGYRANLLIRNLTSHRIITFQLAYSALKLWTKNHFIYGGKFGFLNGTTLTMLLLQVFLKHSDDSAPDLLFQFFKRYSNWQWPARVELSENFNHRTVDNSNHLSLDWSESDEEKDRARHFWLNEYRDEAGNLYLAKHAKLIWPVIVPGFPTQNAAFNVNAWTKQAMQREFEQGLEQMEALRKKIGVNETSEVIWEHWLTGKSFDQKYNHFVAIICAAKSADQLSKFCDYVEGRIRLQLLFSFGDPRFKVQWMHASPVKVRNVASCPSREEGTRLSSAGQWLCTIWLVGVQFSEGREEDNRQIMEEKLTQMDFTEHNEAAQEVGRNEPTSEVEHNKAAQEVGQNEKEVQEVQRNKLPQNVEIDEVTQEFRRDKANETAQEVVPNIEAAQEVAQEAERDEPENEIRKTIRQESFAQRIHESFKNQERRSSSPRSFHSSYSNNSAESPRGNAVSPRGSPSHNGAADSPRQSVLSRHAKMPSSPSPHDAMSPIGQAEAIRNEMVWAKYFDRAQLQAWLKEMGVLL